MGHSKGATSPCFSTNESHWRRVWDGSSGPHVPLTSPRARGGVEASTRRVLTENAGVWQLHVCLYFYPVRAEQMSAIPIKLLHWGALTLVMPVIQLQNCFWIELNRIAWIHFNKILLTYFSPSPLLGQLHTHTAEAPASDDVCRNDFQKTCRVDTAEAKEEHWEAVGSKWDSLN